MCHIQIDGLSIVGLNTFIDNLVTMTDNVLNQQAFHLGGLLLCRMQTDRYYQFFLPFLRLRHSCFVTLAFLLFLFLIALDIGIDSGHQCLLIDIEAMGTFREIGIALQLVGNHRHAFQDTADSFRTFLRVGHAFQQQVGLKLDEVRLVLFYICLKLIGCMFLAKRVGIVTIGQHQYLDIHALGQQHVRSAHGRMDTSLVAIVQQHDILCETMQQPNLMVRQRRTRVGHHVLQTTLVHGNHVGITLDHIDAVLFDDSFLGLIDAVEFVVLMIDFRVRRVDILLLHTLRGCIELTTAKSHHLATDVQPGEHSTTSKTVIDATLVLYG